MSMRPSLAPAAVVRVWSRSLRRSNTVRVRASSRAPAVTGGNSPRLCATARPRSGAEQRSLPGARLTPSVGGRPGQRAMRLDVCAAMTSIQPELWVENAREALAFYAAAFGATVLYVTGTGDE